ncbi:Uncharacterised protein [Bordetella pertussis]|nr:Uncharacterised protein [Bordetella pertussis]CFP69616.1 Uncharacterised protein [Bordetella pertussis]CFU10017.1 Uncharacterised protein [Bordetella pertussis]CFW19644.1 Uncharacterised protein [Bordetella pertussis]CFW47131.1 Uncharacterised protein [Bordetella pertussis]
MPANAMPLPMSLYGRAREGSPSNTSRNRARKRLRASSSMGNSRPGSNCTSPTGYRLRCVSTSKLRIDSISSSNRSSR